MIAVGWAGRAGLGQPMDVPLEVVSCYSLAIVICLQACGTALGRFVAQRLLSKFVAIATSSAVVQAADSSFLAPALNLEYLDPAVLLASPVQFAQHQLG